MLQRVFALPTQIFETLISMMFLPCLQELWEI